MVKKKDTYEVTFVCGFCGYLTRGDADYLKCPMCGDPIKQKRKPKEKAVEAPIVEEEV